MPDVDVKAPFEAYRGTEEFIFVSYSHKDGSAVFPDIAYLHEEGYRIWYDEGIDPGNEWPEEVAKALAGSSYFLVFVSPNAVKSHNVRNEINFALARKKPFLAVHIVETSLPVGLELQIGSIQGVMRFRMSEESYRRKVCSVLPLSLRLSGKEGKQRRGESQLAREFVSQRRNAQAEVDIEIPAQDKEVLSCVREYLCKGSSRLHVWPRLPRSVLEKAKETYGQVVSENEKFLCVYEAPGLVSRRLGFVFTNKGFGFRARGYPSPIRVTWKKLKP